MIMKPLVRSHVLRLFSLPALLPVMMTAWLLAAAHVQAQTEIGGENIVTLTREPVSKTKPEFTGVTVMPGRGMELLYITANFPGKGEVHVLDSPDLATAENLLDHRDSVYGMRSTSMGAAFLVPYPNRVVGKLSADGQTITTTWEGHTLTLPGGGGRRRPAGAEGISMHGLIQKDKAEDIRVTRIAGGEQVTGVIRDAFHGSWLSKTNLVITITLTAEAVDATVVADNVGLEAEPIAIGWHPYFKLPSGQRAQARVRIPASMVEQKIGDSYQPNLPTGKLLPVAGTRFDLRAPGGAPLDNFHFDDNWSHLQWKNGAVTVQVIDPEARYGIDIEGLSRQIKTIQMYSPETSKFVAVEDQYNFVDPLGKEWGGMNTGMVTLKPGQSTTWRMRLHVFVP